MRQGGRSVEEELRRVLGCPLSVAGTGNEACWRPCQDSARFKKSEQPNAGVAFSLGSDRITRLGFSFHRKGINRRHAPCVSVMMMPDWLALTVSVHLCAEEVLQARQVRMRSTANLQIDRATSWPGPKLATCELTSAAIRSRKRKFFRSVLKRCRISEWCAAETLNCFHLAPTMEAFCTLSMTSSVLPKGSGLEASRPAGGHFRTVGEQAFASCA